MNKSKIAVLVTIQAILFACSPDSTQSGVTEAGNTAVIYGVVTDTLGSIISGAKVYLRPQNFLDVDSNIADFVNDSTVQDAYTDMAGVYVFSNVPEGTYHVSSFQESGYTTNTGMGGGLYFGLSDLASLHEVVVSNDTDTVVIQDSIRPTATVKGRLPKNYLEEGYNRVFVSGLEFSTYLDTATGAFDLDNLPAGKLRLTFLGDHNNPKGGYLDVLVKPGEIIDTAGFNLVHN